MARSPFHSGERAGQLRYQNSGLVLSSRMVRRWTAQGGALDAPRAKSWFCIQGHKDPDPVAEVYSPTPQTETFMLALQVAANRGFDIAPADCEKAFCQSLHLRRKRGPLLVTPCHGSGVSDNLIEFNVAFYGLDDALAEFRTTLTSHLIQVGFVKFLLDPCLWLHRTSSGTLDSLIALDLGDLLLGTPPEQMEGLRKKLSPSFGW